MGIILFGGKFYKVQELDTPTGITFKFICLDTYTVKTGALSANGILAFKN